MTPISIHIDVDTPTADELARVQAFFGGAGGTTTGGTGTTTGGTTPTPVVDLYFPADPGNALFPSPEGSRCTVGADGKPGGKKYILDKNGVEYSFGETPILVPVNNFGMPLYQVLINGTDPHNTGIVGDAIIICQNKMFWHAGLYWYTLTGSGGASSTTALPPFFTTGSTGTSAGGGTAAPAMPSPPSVSSPAPGSSGKVVEVGPNQTITTLAAGVAAAQPGDSIHLEPGAVFKESVDLDRVRLYSDGVVANPGTANASFSGGAKIDATGVTLSHGLGALVLLSDCIIEGIEITGAGLNETNRGGTAGVRNKAATNAILRNCFIHDNQDGIGPMEDPAAPSTWLVDKCLLLDNGIGDGGTHNVYLPSTDVSATFVDTTSIVNLMAPSADRATGTKNGGHALKTRGHVLKITGGYYYSGDATPIDIPDGSTIPCVLYGMTIVKKSGDPNHGVIGYAKESTNIGLAGVQVGGNAHFDLTCDNPLMQMDPGASMSFDATVTWAGNKPTAEGGTVTGLPT